MLKALIVKDLRIQLRARNESPAGGIEALRIRLRDHMVASKDFALKNEDGSDMATVHVTAGLVSSDLSAGNLKNNYVRPSGQNVGNFLTERCSSRVLAPPGGGSQVGFSLSQHGHRSLPSQLSFQNRDSTSSARVHRSSSATTSTTMPTATPVPRYAYAYAWCRGPNAQAAPSIPS